MNSYIATLNKDYKTQNTTQLDEHVKAINQLPLAEDIKLQIINDLAFAHAIRIAAKTTYIKSKVIQL